MKKVIFIPVILILAAIVLPNLARAVNSDQIYDGHERSVGGDYHRISVYSVTSQKDSTSFAARSAVYYPMDRTVEINGSHYDVQSNSDYGTSAPSKHFRYTVGSYYTNLD